MATPNRGARLSKAHKVLKKHYQPISPPADRQVFEHLLYACCLENASYEAADEAFARLQETYFDWNEVRVTTVSELAEVMTALPEPEQAAQRLKKVLQSVFESHYSFDVEPLKKQNLGKAVKRLEKYAGVTPFAVGYVTQAALGGHAIAVDDAALDLMQILGVITEAERGKQQVPGLERAIAKNKGVEFASLMHQLAAELRGNPHGTRVRSIILEIDPDAKDRLPKRGTKKEDEAAAAPSAAAAPPPASGGEGDKPAPKVASKKKVRPPAPPPEAPPKQAKSQPAAKAAASAGKKSTSKSISRKKPR
jgi:endonuclease-3